LPICAGENIISKNQRNIELGLKSRSEKLKKPFEEKLPFRKPLEPTPLPFPIEPQRFIYPPPDETQRVLKEILARLDTIEKRLSSIEKTLATRPTG